jgi:hypothetical protein
MVKLAERSTLYVVRRVVVLPAESLIRDVPHASCGETVRQLLGGRTAQVDEMSAIQECPFGLNRVVELDRLAAKATGGNNIRPPYE